MFMERQARTSRQTAAYNKVWIEIFYKKKVSKKNSEKYKDYITNNMKRDGDVTTFEARNDPFLYLPAALSYTYSYTAYIIPT